MKIKRYEGMSPDEIRKLLNGNTISRRQKYRIAKETGIAVPGIRNQPAEKEISAAYEVSKGPWV